VEIFDDDFYEREDLALRRKRTRKRRMKRRWDIEKKLVAGKISSSSESVEGDGEQ